MLAATITRPGGPEVLELREAPIPEPAAGQILVRVRSFSLNRADLLQCRGHYPAPPGWPQDIPGLEYAGEVEKLGPDVEGVAVGNRVMGIVGGGAYAEYVTTPADHAVPIPEKMPYEEAAAIPEAFITAFDALERIAVKTGEWVLVHAVGSGVGTAAVQLIKVRDALCVGTSRTPSKLERAVKLGMDGGVDSSREELVPAVKQITARGTDAAVDLVGGTLFNQTLEAMVERGRVILVGLTAGRTAELDLSVILRKRLRIEGTVLRGRSYEEKSAVTKAFIDMTLPLFSMGKLSPVVDRAFSLEEVSAALSYLESNASFGKVVVRVG